MRQALCAPGPPASRVAAQRPAAGSRLGWLLISLVVLLVLVALSVTLGARHVAVSDVVAALGGDTGTVSRAAVSTRIPRTVLALVAGAALGVSGAVMQGLTRNPLADPGMLGITPGASLAVVGCIAFVGMTSPIATVWVAIAGAAVTAVIVYLLGSMGRGGATPLKLSLAGAAVTASISSLISAILLPRADVMNSFRFWQIGGVGGADFARIGMVAPFLAAGFFLSIAVTRGLNALALGDDVAAGLGEHVGLLRSLAGIGAVLLCGAATAVAGPIAFVGLVVPHSCRLLTGGDHRWLVPFSAVAGGGLLVVADIVGRVAGRPAEIDAGIVTAIIGAPVFIAIVRRQKGRAP